MSYPGNGQIQLKAPLVANGGMPMSLQGALYEAMSTMSGYSLKMMESMQHYQQEFLEAFGGWSKSANGDLVLNNKNGIISRFLDTSLDAAEEAGQALRNDAVGTIVAGAIGAASLIGAAGAYMKFRDPSLESEMRDANEFQENLNLPSNAKVEVGAAGKMQNSKEQKIEEKIEGWASGDKSKLTRFAARNGDGTINSEDAALNKEAADHLRNNHKDYHKVCKNLDEHKEMLEKRMEANEGRFSRWVNFLNIGSNAGQSGAQGGGKMAQAANQVESQSDQARSEVLRTDQQQMMSGIDDAKQKMNSFAQMSLEYATMFGQLSSVRG